jgi:hypothetical protein
LSIVLSNSNWLSFNVFSFCSNFHYLLILDVDKLIISILEDLPPIWVGSRNLELFLSTIAHNVPWPGFV